MTGMSNIILIIFNNIFNTYLFFPLFTVLILIRIDWLVFISIDSS